MNRIKIIVCFLLLSATALSQLPPWNFITTTQSHTITISNDTLYNKDPLISKVWNPYPTPGYDTILKTGDYLGVFYNRSGTDYCAGYIKWNSGNDSILTAWAYDGVNGIMTGDKITYRIWRSDAKCEFRNVAVFYSLDSINKDTLFKVSGKSRISGINAFIEHIYFNESAYCNTITMPISPSYYYSLSPGTTFSSSPAGLSLDSATGTFIPQTSLVGSYVISINTSACIYQDKYTVKIANESKGNIVNDTVICNGQVNLVPGSIYSNVIWNSGPDTVSTQSYNISNSGLYTVKAIDTNGCAVYDTFKVTVSDMNISGFSFTTEDATCYELGKLMINDGASGLKNSKYKINIINKITNQATYYESQIGSMSTLAKDPATRLAGLPEGYYDITLIDNYGCSKKWNDSVQIKRNCNVEYPVFSPNNDGIEDEYLIDMKGTVKIYDKNGVKKAEFVAPYYWNGTDHLGALLPMGTYLMVDEFNHYINITIIR